jgi:hypothetical protein
MAYTFRDLIQFLNGRGPPFFHIADLPEDLWPHLKARKATIWLEYSYARKLWEKHRLLPQHFHLIDVIVKHGWCGMHGRDLLFLYDDDNIFGASFKLVVKSANQGKELWVKTFHRLGADDIVAKLKQAQQVRDWPR